MQKPRITSAVLVEKDGKFLLGRRNKVNAYGTWIIPGGGVEWGESISEAALREIKEETNLDVELLKFIGFKEVIVPEVDYHRVIFFHLAKPLHDDVEAREDLDEVGFFSIDEIKKLETVKSVEWVFRELGLW